MQKTKQTSTKLLVITITTVAIIAALTTVSISAATPAFAKVNCTQTPEGRTCSGGESFKARGEDIPGGTGSHATESSTSRQGATSGGFGSNDGTSVGGGGLHRTCDESGSCQTVGGSGQHPQGPGGNSGNAPPQ